VRNAGDPPAWGVADPNRDYGPWRRRESERPIVLVKPRNGGGGKGPHFEGVYFAAEGRRLA